MANSTTIIKRVLTLFLAMAMVFLVFSINVSAGAEKPNDEIMVESDETTDEAQDETKDETVAKGASGFANEISPFTLDYITGLAPNTELDVNTLYQLKDTNWTIRADGYFIQADDLVPILDSVTEIFTNYVTLSNFGHFLIIYNYSDSQGVRTIGPLPVLSPTPGANGLTPWGKEVKWDLKEILKDDSGTPFPDKSELYIEVRYAKSSTGQMTPDSAGVILNHEYIEPEVTLNGGTGTGPVYHPTSIDFVSNRDHGLDIDGRDTTNVWGIEDEAGDLVSGGRWSETAKTWEFAPGFALAASSFDDGDAIINKKIGLVGSTGNDTTLPAGTYKAVTSEVSTTKYGNPIPPKVARDTFALLTPLTSIGGVGNTNNADPTNPNLTPPLSLDPDNLIVRSKFDSSRSTSTWILSKDGNQVSTGTFAGTDTDHTIANPNAPGKYTVQIIETMKAEYGGTKHVTTGTFSFGKVIYTYEDTDGNSLIPTIPVPPSIGTTGDPYTVPPAPTIPGYTVTLLPPVGDYTDGETTATYVYKKNITKVVVKHKYDDGSEVIPSVETTGPYNTTENTAQLTRKDIKIVQVFLDNAGAGDVDTGDTNNVTATYPPTDTTTVTYVYTRVMTEVIVKHLYEDGTEVPDHPQKSTTGQVGTTTATSKVAGEKFVSVSVNGTGTGNTNDVTATFPDTGTTTVVYVYKRPATLVVKHLFFEEDGTTASSTPTQSEPVKKAFVGDNYTTSPLASVPAGYFLAPFADSGNVSGQYAASQTTVTYSYKKIPVGTLIVKHLFFEEDGTTASSTPTQSEPTKTGYVGDPYTTSALKKVPAGYFLAPFADSGNVSGQYAASQTTVTYSYKKIPKGTLEVNHIFLDDKGKITTNPPTITKNFTDEQGKPYTTTSLIAAEIPDGYRLVSTSLPSNASGKYSATHAVVNYYYSLIPLVQPGRGTVTVVHTIEHTDGTTTVVQRDDPLTDYISNPYTSADIKIPGYTLKEVPSNKYGSIKEGNQNVHYVYVPNPAEAQLVEKHYMLDAYGGILGEVQPAKMTIGPDRSPYGTFPRPPAGYELVIGKAPDNARGRYKTGVEQVVIYYYAPKVTTIPPITGGDTGGSSSGNTSGSSWLGGTNTDGTTKPATSSGKNDPLNPQTGDQGIEQTILHVLYAVLSAALLLFAFMMTRLDKKKRSKRRNR